MEAFSDAVIAILITIMVLELHVPHHRDLAALHPLLPVFLSYALSFVVLGIYWNNHHHLLQIAHRINGRVLWANLHLLFWLSLFPFVTAWMGENHFAQTPTVIYGVVLLCAALAYFILQTAVMREQGPDSALAQALGRDIKGKLSPVVYLSGIALTFVNRWLGLGAYVVVTLMWLVPDRRLESHVGDHEKPVSAGRP
jgi:uncharacterized membrane protein